jgi:hypothetical protein
LGGRNIEGRLILKFMWPRTGSIEGLSEHGEETSGFIKDGEFLDQLNECDLSRKELFRSNSELEQLLNRVD